MFKKFASLSILFFSFHSYANSQMDRVVQAHGQLLTEYQQQITELQTEVDQLRGQLEQTTYLLNQTIERQKLILQQLANNSSPNNTTRTSASTVKSVPTSLANWTPSGDEKTDYNFIIKFVIDGKESKAAITAFQQFLKDYPKSSYRANVNYWLGQLCYKQGRKDDASFYFAVVVKDYPKSAKAADSLYKIGVILLDKGEKAKAKAVFEQVIIQYPKEKSIISATNNKLATLG